MTATARPPVRASAPATGSALARSAAARELAAAFKGCLGAARRLRGRETRCHDGLTEAQFGLLWSLREREHLPLSELAALADVSPATATQMLDGLAAAGLVRRVRSDRDRRVVLTSLTERGQGLLEERHAAIAPRWDAALAGFSDAELRTAARVLEGLRGMLEEIEPGR